MARKIRQRGDGEWMFGSKVLASPIFYGNGWMVKEEIFYMKSSAKDPRRRFRSFRQKFDFPIEVDNSTWSKGSRFLPPDFGQHEVWSARLTTFAPSADTRFVENG